MADSLDRATRPSGDRKGKRKVEKKERGNIDLMAERWAKGLDIWTGKPLTDKDLKGSDDDDED